LKHRTYPRKGYTVLNNPTSQETPSFVQLLEFENSVKTYFASCLGAMTLRTITIAMNPARWRTPTCVSNTVSEDFYAGRVPDAKLV
jgi:hypothetical protein